MDNRGRTKQRASVREGLGFDPEGSSIRELTKIGKRKGALVATGRERLEGRGKWGGLLGCPEPPHWPEDTQSVEKPGQEVTRRTLQ